MKFRGFSWFFLLAAISATGCSTGRSAPSHQRVPIDIPQLREFTVTTAECYALSYSDPRNGGRAELFPLWLALFPGVATGPADGKPHPVYARDWTAVITYKTWRRIAADSVRVMFTGAFEGMDIRVARMDSTISGRAIWLTDLVGLPIASMHVVGTREACPKDVINSK